MAPVGLKHWMLHNDQLANEYDETLKLSPGYDPVRAVDPALTFHAPLLTGPNSIPGAIRATFERNSEATYLAPRGRFGLIAQDDESRHEYTPQDEPIGVLMEPAKSNKCENWNANPDADLTNIGISAGPGLFSRELLPEILQLSGLSAICKSGYVFCLDTRGVAATDVIVEGTVQTLNPHVYSGYVHCVQGSGFIALSGVASTDFFVTEIFERVHGVATPDLTSRQWQIRADADSLVYFVLNQLEELSTPSSVIVTEGAATSRAVDQLSWPLWTSPYGPQYVRNGDFQSSEYWQATPPWVIADGKACIDGSQVAGSDLFQDIDFEPDQWYQFRVDHFDRQGGNFVPYINGTAGDLIYFDGSYQQFIKAGASGGLVLTSSIDHIGCVDNISVRKVDFILNQAEGMGAIIVRFQYGKADTEPNSFRSIAGLEPANTSWVSEIHAGNGNTYLELTDQTNFSNATLDDNNGPEPGIDYLIAWRWSDVIQIGFKKAGIWIWGNSPVYSGSFDEDGFLRAMFNPQLPKHGRDLRLWSKDRGSAWLEDFFEGVAE